MRPMARRFRRLGYDVLIVDYPTRRQTPAQSAAAWVPHIRRFAGGQTVSCIGHSLGGLFIRHLHPYLPEQIHRVVTLGTPHLHSAAGQYFRRFWRGRLIGQSWEEGLDGRAPAWDARIPLLSIAGTRAQGVGKWFGLFRDEANDGTVAVSETRLPQAQGYRELPYSHTGLIFAGEVVAVAHEWLVVDDKKQR